MSRSSSRCAVGSESVSSRASVSSTIFWPAAPVNISLLTASMTCCVRTPRTIASSADGTKLVAGTDYGTNYGDLPSIYISSDSGANWKLTSAPNQPWQTVASSTDGTKLAAGIYGGLIYLSKDSGESWTPANVPALRWCSIASSSDGSRLAAAAWEGMIYLSADGGRTWTTANAPSQQWQSIASSSDGIKLVAAIYNLSGGGVYSAIAPPALKIGFSGNQVVLSWPASADCFILQENGEFSGDNWSDVTGAESLVDGNKQVVLFATNGRRFYRLIQRQ